MACRSLRSNALSTAVPVMIVCFAPSVETVTGGVHDAMPLIAAKHVKLTVTFELFHPAALGTGSR